MTQKVAAMGNWWLAASSWQRTHSCIMSHTEFFCETSNHPGDSAPYSPDLVPWDFWLFPELKSPLNGERFQTGDEIQENTKGQLMVTGRTVRGPKVPVFITDAHSFMCLGAHFAPKLGWLTRALCGSKPQITWECTDSVSVCPWFADCGTCFCKFSQRMINIELRILLTM